MTVEVVFVGAGEAARNHLANMGKLNVAVKAVADIDYDKARQLADELGATAYQDGIEMADAEKPHAAYVCIPPGEHGSLEIELADMGIPFFIEKPIHLDIDVAVQVSEMVREKDLVTAVGYQARYSEAVQAAREYLSNRQLTLVQGFCIGGLPQKPWWRRKSLSGGQVVISSHMFDLLRYLVGEVETVCAFGTTGAMVDVPDYTIEDATVAALEFSDGAIGQVASACVLKGGGEPRIGLRFDGRGYTLRLDPQRLTVSDSCDRREDIFHGSPADDTAKADEAFIRAVATGDRSGIFCDYEDAVRTLDLTLAVDESLMTRELTSPSRILLNASH